MTPEEAAAQGAAMNQGLTAALADRNAAGLGPASAAPAQHVNLPGIGDAIKNPDGTYTITSGPRAGLNLDASGKPLTVPGLGDSAHGGLDPGDYNVNPDGTITVIHPPTTGNSAGNFQPGEIIGTDGRTYNPDGTPRVDAKGAPIWTTWTSTGKPATANPNYNGEGVLTNDSGSGLVDQVPGFTELKNILNQAVTPGTPIDTGAITAASQRSAGLSDQFNQQYQNFKPGEAPVALSQQIQDVERAQQQSPIAAGTAAAGLSNAAQIPGTTLAQGQAPISAERIQATLAGGQAPISTERVQAALAAQQGPISAQQVSAALTPEQRAIAAQQLAAAQAGRTTLGPTALAGATQQAPADQAAMTQLGPTALAQAAQVDQSKQAQFRQGQEGLVSGLQGAISGSDPSVAALMLRQATERNIANQFALAKASRGMESGLAQRQAMIGAADLNQQSIGQQALLRAQEIATARGQLGGALDSGRGQDLTLAAQQAQLSQQAGLANQGALDTAGLQQGQMDVQTRLANAGFTNTANMSQAQLSQALALANAGFRNTATTTQAQLDAAQAALNAQQTNAVGIANQGAGLQAQTTNATLAQQAALANAAAQNQAAQANQSANLQAGTTSATLAQQAALANAASQNQAALANQATGLAAGTTNATLAQQQALANAAAQNAANQANQSASLQAGTTNATLGQQLSLANAGAQNTTAQQNASLANASNLANAQNQTSTSVANAGNQTSANTASAQLANQVALANAAAGNAAQQTNAQLGTQTAIANAGNATTTAGQNIAAQNNLAQNALTGSGQVITGAIGAANAQAEQAKAEAAKQAAILGAGATAGAALLSDRRAKTDIRPGELDVGRFLDDLKAYGFKYKDPDAPGAAPGRRTGIMVQDLEKSPLGRSLVRETPAGKAVDVNQATGAALAALAQINARLSKVEGRA